MGTGSRGRSSPPRRPAPIVYNVEEYAPAEVPLSDLLDDSGRLQLNPDVEAKGYFTVQLVKGRVRLQAGGYVGLIPLNERVVIDVVPRAPVANLSRLLRVSRYMPQFLLSERRYERDHEWNESLLDLYAGTLVKRVEIIASSGLLQEYRRREADTSFPRGRILVESTYGRLRPRGVTYKVATSWFERTPDNQPNRCIKYALWFLADRLARLGQIGRLRRELLLRIGGLYELFRQVPLDHSLRFLHDPVVRGVGPIPSLRDYYRAALDMAVVAVMEHGITLESHKSGVELPSLILNMNRVVEDYLRRVLQERAVSDGWDTEVLDGNTDGKKILFDASPSEDVTPDIVFRNRSDHRYPLIIEIKNVPVAGNSARPAMEQCVTYAATYRCERLVLVHPRGRGQAFTGLRLQGRIGDLSIYQYIFDLGGESIEGEEAIFAQAMHSIASKLH